MTLLSDLKIAILAYDGVDQSEVADVRQALEERGITVHIIAPEATEIKSWDKDFWSIRLQVDKCIYETDPQEYDGLILPGGPLCTDKLRLNNAAIDFAKYFFNSGKIVGAISHGAQLLISAELVEGKQITSAPSIKFDLINAGALWFDQEIVVDNGLVTCQGNLNLDLYVKKLVEQLKEGVHQRAETII